MTTLLSASLLALGLLAGPAHARDVSSVWTAINDTAPRSVFDQIADTAPRSAIAGPDQLDSELHPSFERLGDAAP